MNDVEIRAMIKEEVNKMVSGIILNGQAGATTVDVEDIDNMYPGMPTVTKRPVVHPYGYASRAPRGVLSVIARIGEHFGNRYILGHRDNKKPQLNEGETAVYSLGGHLLKVSNDQIEITHKTGSTFQIIANGSIQAATKGGNLLFMNEANGELTLTNKSGKVIALKPTSITIGTPDHTIDIDGDRLQIAGKKIVINGEEVTVNGGNINVGGNSNSQVIGEQLEAYLLLITTALLAVGQTVPPPAVNNANPVTSFKSLYVKIRSNLF